ncbi:hypothetical protein PENTCL1PPCAC_30744, partial [Pristionchus entomophagus]
CHSSTSSNGSIRSPSSHLLHRHASLHHDDPCHSGQSPTRLCHHQRESSGQKETQPCSAVTDAYLHCRLSLRFLLTRNGDSSVNRPSPLPRPRLSLSRCPLSADVPLYASPFLLVAISADRYQAICRPLDNFRQSRYRRPNCLAAVAWAAALLLSIPQLFVWQMTTYTGAKTGRKFPVCKTTYGHGQTWFKTFYILLFNGLAWLLPSFLAAFFYYNVCKAVWRSHRPEKMVKSVEKNNMATQKYIEKLREASCGHKRQSSEFDRKRTQTVRLTMTIIACNFFLWAPFCITNIIQAISPEMISKEAIIFLVIFGNLNSCVNPWIYILFNRKHVARAFCGRPSKGET